MISDPVSSASTPGLAARLDRLPWSRLHTTILLATMTIYTLCGGIEAAAQPLEVLTPAVAA